ncbi:MAG: hypothetical protein ABIE03_05680 [Patescibacteria group bacterium]|nr:hypothetical protein [Patescibacteria group bacterium]
MNQNLLERIQYVFSNCHHLINSTFGRDFSVVGNVGIFSQSEEEYKEFKSIANELIKK